MKKKGSTRSTRKRSTRKRSTRLRNIALPRVPPWEEFLKHHDRIGLKRHILAQCMRQRVWGNVTNQGREYPAEGFFSPASREEKKLVLLESLEERYEEQLSETGVPRLRAQDYLEMVFIIEAIKELAADPECFFDVPSIMEKTEKDMKGNRDSWEWISVHTE